MQTVTDEILKGLPPDQNGTLSFTGMNPKGQGLSDIFSFTYYLMPKKNSTNFAKNFMQTKYYQGLKAYIEMVHSPEFPFKGGVIVYTDSFTKPILESLFPLNDYPNLVLALVNWPYFTNEKGNVDQPVLRMLRYQAVDHFPTHNVHMRDADTLFVALMKRVDFLKHVLDWETAYLQFVPKVAATGKQIILGSNEEYQPTYHDNMAFPSVIANLTKLNSGKRAQSNYKYMSYNGVFAGFASVLENREGIEEFWRLCVEYALQRYYMVEDPETKELVTINYLYKISYADGKNERMLLYSVIPKLMSKIYFMNVDYDEREIKDFYYPAYFNTLKVNNQKSQKITKIMSRGLKEYQNWSSSFYKQFPTNKNYAMRTSKGGSSAQKTRKRRRT